MRRTFIRGLLVVLAIVGSLALIESVSAKKGTESLRLLTPQAGPILIDDFTYSTGQLTDASGGANVSGGNWVTNTGTGNFLQVSGGGLSYTGYPSSGVGNKLDIVSTTASAEDTFRNFTAQTSGTTYAAFMVNVTNTTGLSANSSTTGDYFAGFTSSTSTTAFVDRVTIRAGSVANTYQLGLRATANAGNVQAFSTTDLPVGTTALVVISYQIVAGAANDVCNMWVNPVITGSEPASTISQVSAADNPDAGRIFFRQGNLGTPNASVDGVRVATSWANLTASTAPPDANADFNGDGKTDFTAIRGTGSPFAGSSAGTIPTFKSNRERLRFQAQHPELFLVPSGQTMYWYTFANGSGAVSVTPWGDAITDIPTPGDFDGDGKDDIAIWRNGGPGVAGFYIFQSSNSTLRFVAYGETPTDPTVVADYDGDGKDDPAAFGCPATGSGQCYFTYMGSLNNPSGNITYIPWGVGAIGDMVPDPGDYDGDGKADFCVQRVDPNNPAQAQFALLKSNGFGVELINWGVTSDFVLPGDYDGDGKADFMVARTSGGVLQHFLYTRTGTVRVANWGITGDAPVPGDYDGDGKADLAVWRPSATPGQSTFYVYRSTDATVQIVPWGQCAVNPCDLPAAGWQVQ